MKKSLLTLGVLALSFSANAQVFYSGDHSKMFVAQKALVYSGGDWMVNSNQERTVENKGDIVIVGNYKKGQIETISTAQDGKEFVNVYTSSNDYGQVKLLETLGASDARMSVERPAASDKYFGIWYPISLPYQDNIPYLMKSFGLQETDFKGDCPKDKDCGGNLRYEMTILKWNNNEIRLDAVPTGSKLQAGDYYNLNLTDKAVNVKNNMAGNIFYKGVPDGSAYTQIIRDRKIFGLAPTENFNDMGYNQWKVKLNPYNESYDSYMGKVNTNSKVYNKNVFRFGNPYTSNLDLSAIDGTNAWVRILNNGKNLTLKQAYEQDYVEGFSISKRMSDYVYAWGLVDGSSNIGTPKYHKAELIYPTLQWKGSPEALLIRPTETFNLNFAILDPTPAKLGSRLLQIQVDFNDNHKTFEHEPSAKNASNPELVSSYSFDNNSMGMMLAKDISYNNIQGYDFYQLEVVLSKNNEIYASPVYIVGGNGLSESGSKASNGSSLFVYGINNGAIAYDSQKDFNEFNSDTYVGKPLGLGFDKLENGQTYQLRFALYEDSIFNRVEALKKGVFYLKDNATNKVTEVSPNDVINFVADESVAKRFEFYWKEVPKVEGTLSTSDIMSNKSTMVYKDGDKRKVRFENVSNTAKVEIFSVAGTLLYSKDGVSTSTDYILDLVSEGVYVVKVIYQNGEVRTVKVVNN